MDYKTIRSIGSAYGETKDCTVVCSSLLMETTYEDAWNMLQAKGRKIGQGLHLSVYKSAMEERGLQFELILERHRGGTGYHVFYCSNDHYNLRAVRTVADLPLRLTKGKYMVRTSGHVLTLIDGKVQDWTDDRSHRVLEIWKVTGEAVKNPDAVMPIGMRRHREEGRKGLNSAVRTRTDTFQWELRRADTQQVIHRYKRASRKIINGVQQGTIYLRSDRFAPLVLVNIKTGQMYRKGCAAITF